MDSNTDISPGAGQAPSEPGAHVSTPEAEILPPDAEHEAELTALAVTAASAIEGITKQSTATAINQAIEAVYRARLELVDEMRALDAIKVAMGWGRDKKTEFAKLCRHVKNRVEFGGPKPWANDLRKSKGDDEAKPIMLNAAIVLQSAPELDCAFAFNEFAGMLWVRRAPPWERGVEPGAPCDRPWTDEDEVNCVYWMQGRGDLHIPKQIIFEAVDYVARQNKFHPVRDWFATLPLDEPFERFDYWPTHYLGVKDTAYSRAVGVRWLISVVARVLWPGCKSDCALILEGEQGIGKSTAFKTLAGGEEWFTDAIVDLADKDTALRTRGKLIVELAELDALRKTEVSRQKVYLSRTVDEFRPPYGRMPVKWPRQFSVAGTVNESRYLRDGTGGRRFWPLIAGTINTDALEKDRGRLFAEAIRRYKANAKWHLDTFALIQMAKVEQRARLVDDVFEGQIEEWIAERERDSAPEHFTMKDVFKDALHIVDASKWTRNEQARIADALRALGYEHKPVRVGKGKESRVVWGWVKLKPDTPAAPPPILPPISWTPGSASPGDV